MSAPAEQPEPSEPTEAPTSFKLRRLEIENFKAIDKLTLELPAPPMEDDPDVFVIGSKNGVGKTSVLEACALISLAGVLPSILEPFTSSDRYPLRPYFIRAGSAELRLRGTLSDPHEFESELILPRDKPYRVHGPGTSSRISLDGVEKALLAPFFADAPEPFSIPHCIYLHSNRRMPHGAVAMDDAKVGGRALFGWIKHKILRFLLAQAGLFEDIRASSVEETARVLLELFRDFADASLSKLRTEPNNRFDIRVQPLRGGDSFSIDALSSGQKEMITTLFLIWSHTQDNPGLVLIDEPELHLNAEWQIKFVRLLFKLAPQNQYIFATHSEYIFRSVQEDRRILLGPQG